MKTIESNNGIYEIHRNYVIARYHNDIHVELDEANFIVNMITENFTCEFGFISDRVNSYSFHPFLIFKVLQKITNLKCFASVTYNNPSKSTHYMNNEFPRNIQIREFSSLPSATEWIKTIIS